MRKSIHNKLLEIQGNIRVLCRVRPVLDIERKGQMSDGDVDVTGFPTPEDLTIQRDPQTKSRYLLTLYYMILLLLKISIEVSFVIIDCRFEFDRVFPPGTPQDQVFEAVQPLVVSVLDGYNICM